MTYIKYLKYLNDIGRFSKKAAAFKLETIAGNDYSNSIGYEDYQYVDVEDEDIENIDEMKIGDFDSQHRLVGGMVEKFVSLSYCNLCKQALIYQVVLIINCINELIVSMN